MDNTTHDESLTLESVEHQFELWRVNRPKREPIPEPLWEAAASLCGQHPITHVCRRLRLSFTELKKRLSAPKQEPLRFMEVDLSSLSGPWHLECERPDGAKLRFSGNGHCPSIESLLEHFLS